MKRKIKNIKKILSTVRRRIIPGVFFVSSIIILIVTGIVRNQLIHYETTVVEMTRNHLVAAARALVPLISIEELDRYHTLEDTENSEYEEIRQRLVRFAEEYNVLYAYYWRDYDGEKLHYIIDSDPDPVTRGTPNRLYEYIDAELDALAGNISVTELGAYTPNWEGIISAFVPVFDSDGNVYAVAGVDIQDEFIIMQRRDARNMTIIQFIIIPISIIFGIRSMMLYRRKAKAAEIANTFKTSFLAVISHEIRTPLNAIIGLSEIELGRSLPQPTKKNINYIYQAGTNLLEIINDILDISKIETGKFEITNDVYDTASFISDVTILNKVRIGGKPIQFILEIDNDFPAKLTGDELRVRQILNNLLSNAIKYTEKGTVTLRAMYEPLADNDTDNKIKIVFEVHDTGVGIRAEDIEKLFHDYTRINTKFNRNIEGTGLGLSIAKRLAKMMHGDISVESEYGVGSCFKVSIIQERTDSSCIGETIAEELRSFSYSYNKSWTGNYTPASLIVPSIANDNAFIEAAGKPYHGHSLLVVDDKPVNLLVIRGQLKPYGFKVDTAASGLEAIEKTKEKQYSIIFMDHLMPDIDGVEAMKKIKENASYAQIPIVALTANAFRGMKEIYLEKGFQDFISKPINPRVLDEVIKKWIALPNNGALPVNFNLEMDSQRLDSLKHMRMVIENNYETDDQYFNRFTKLIETIKISEAIDAPERLREQADFLINAGYNKDRDTIRDSLGVFCEELGLWIANETSNKSAIAEEIVKRLNIAIQNGDTVAAGKIITELGAVKLSAAERDWYFTIYDSLMEDNTKRALETINLWLA